MAVDPGAPFRWTGGAIAAAATWIGKSIKNAAVWLWDLIELISPWLFGLGALVAPYLLLETLASEHVSVWSDVYIAGAVGGLILELLRGRWRLELPSKGRGIGRDAEKSFSPFGPLTDIGFLGRMTTGAVAAPVFLAILNALDATEPQASDISAYLATIASRADTLAWAVLIGALSPAVWSMGESLVKARFAIADTQLDAMKKSVASAAKDLKGQQVKVDQAIAKVVDAAAKAPPTSEAAAPPVTTPEVNRVAGVIETELGSDAATVVRKALEGNGGGAVAPTVSFDEITRDFLEQQSALGKAIGALEACATVAEAGPTGTGPPPQS